MARLPHNFRPPSAIRSLPEELPAPSEFRNPPSGYGPVPFWFWNARMEEEEVRRQVREMAEKGCSGAFLHARHGLKTAYLSEEWFHLVRAAVEEASPLGFQIWLYDEDNWPSGTAGGAVTAAHPEYRARYLQTVEASVDGESAIPLPEGEFLGAWAVPLGEAGHPSSQPARLIPDASGHIRCEAGGGRRRVLLFSARDGGYVDLLNHGATALFLRLTHDRYASALGRHLGRTVPGVFMDETTLLSVWNVADRSGLPWSPLLPDAFQQRCGYSLLDCLPALVLPVADAARVRCDYFATLSALYTENFFRPIQRWCAKHKIASTGHVLMEEPLATQLRYQANTMAVYRHLDIPGVDNLTTRFGGLHHRLAASAAHQSHRSRVLSETFGGAGWGATLAQRKACADWQLANGINLFVPHAIFYTVYGKRKREAPPSEFEQEPFWPHYRVFADYLARLCTLLTRGKHSARIAVLLPLRSAWAHYYAGYAPASRNEQARAAYVGYGSPDSLLLQRVERDLFTLCDLLSSLHFDYDFVDEDALAAARIEKSRLCLGPERYELLLLPSMTTCARATWARVREFFEEGGNVLSCGLLPFQTGEGEAEDTALRAEVQDLTTVDPTRPEKPGGGSARAMGREAMRPLNVNRQHGSRVARYLPSRVPLPSQRALLMETLLRTLVTIDVDLDCPEVICHQRETADGKIYLLANTADETRDVKAVFYARGCPEEWDAETGEVRRIWQYARAGEKVTLAMTFAPHQARAIVFAGAESMRVERANFVVTEVTESEDSYLVQGHARDWERPMDTPPNCLLSWEGGSRWAEGVDKGLLEPIHFGDEWDCRVLGENYLFLPDWRFHIPRQDQDAFTPAVFQDHWEELPPREPVTASPRLEPLERELPHEAWFQTRFRLDVVPHSLSLLLEPLDVPNAVFVNGHEISPQRTGVLDPQFLTADIADVAVEGENVVSLRISYAGVHVSSPDNLHRITADLIPEPARLLGNFTVKEEEGEYLAAPGAPPRIRTGSWTAQGFPHFSGVLEYTQPVFVAPDYFEFQLVLVCEAVADIVEVLVNGRPAGVRLWPPYALDISEYLFAGTNTVSLRVTNTAANALLGRLNPSGLLGPVRIQPFARFEVVVPRQ